jgi:hypothetical protein
LGTLSLGRLLPQLELARLALDGDEHAAAAAVA